MSVFVSYCSECLRLLLGVMKLCLIYSLFVKGNFAFIHVEISLAFSLYLA
jgi:hypothetical protein